MTGQTEFRTLDGALEFRAGNDGLPVVSGVAVRYGQTSTVAPGLRERFLPGAFGSVTAADVVLRFQHDRSRPLARTGGSGLVLEDSAEALRARAELDPETRDGADAERLLRRKIMRGFSVEFLPVQQVFEGGIRTIRQARLVGLGLVDSPAHRGSVAELRQLAQRCRDSDGRRARRFYL